jgi:DDE_Tnp_1-associated
MDLLSSFSNLVDSRRRQGMRVSLPQILTMTFLAYLCGYHSYRKIFKFCQASAGVLVPTLGLKHGVPSYITFREVLQSLDDSLCIAAFNDWARHYVNLTADDCMSGDGKSLRSTLCQPEGKQNFKAVVSFFAHKTGLVYQIAQYQNQKVSEIEIVYGLLESLRGLGLTLCLDALHTQKKL